MTLIRPEGLILAGLGDAGLALRSWPPELAKRASGWWGGWRCRSWPGLIQPLINWLATGSTILIGDAGEIASVQYRRAVSRIVWQSAGIFRAAMWRELLSGRSPDFGTFTSPLLAEVGAGGAAGRRVAGAGANGRVNCRRVVMLAWMVALTAAVATLDTAFWQFKRYQLPIMALFFPAAAWGSAAVWRSYSNARLRSALGALGTAVH